MAEEFMSSGLNLGDKMSLAYLVMLAIGALASWYTVGLYVKTQRNWWNPVAQVILVTSVAFAAIFTWVFLARLWPSIPGRTVIGFSLFSLVMAATLWKAWVLTKLFRTVKKEKDVRSS